MITFHNVSKYYQSDKDTQLTALKHINLNVKAGEIFGIIGKSGAGKSTLLRCINHLEKPTSGYVSVNNASISTLNTTQLRNARHNIGMIFQHFNLLNSLTVFDNICLPLKLQGIAKNSWEERVKPLLELTQLQDKKNSYPTQLSGGQKQRVAIARALVKRPNVLLCDEATSALDLHTTQNILHLLKDINQRLGITILLITHEMNVIKSICDRVALLDQGSIIEEQAVIDFFAQPKTSVAKALVNTCMEHPLPAPLAQALKPTPVSDTDEVNSNSKLDSSTHGNKEHSNFQANHHHAILRIRFNGSITAEPIIANFIQQQQVTMNIVQANMEYIQDHAIGTMILSLNQSHETKAIQYLANNGLNVEVLGYVHNLV